MKKKENDLKRAYNRVNMLLDEWKSVKTAFNKQKELEKAQRRLIKEVKKLRKK